MRQYYTPKLEEFHVGFLYEYRVDSKLDIWESASFGFDVLTVNRFCNPLLVETRVKYLDEKDVIDCGFEKITDKIKWSYLYGEYRMDFKEDKSLTLKPQGDNWIITITDHFDYDGHNEFEIVIKNKAELIKLIKQLGL